jgi:CDP-L-myo-inositol myo-inositolphosphotransferase
LDGCDGEIARLKFCSTPKGAWMDSIMDRYADFILIAALAYGQWAASPDVVWWILALFAILGSYGVSYTSAAFRSALQKGLPMGRQIPAKRDTRLLIIAVSALTNLPLSGLLLIGILGNAEVLRRLAIWR